jgi:hypothetical protein
MKRTITKTTVEVAARVVVPRAAQRTCNIRPRASLIESVRGLAVAAFLMSAMSCETIQQPGPPVGELSAGIGVPSMSMPPEIEAVRADLNAATPTCSQADRCDPSRPDCQCLGVNSTCGTPLDKCGNPIPGGCGTCTIADTCCMNLGQGLHCYQDTQCVSGPNSGTQCGLITTACGQIKQCGGCGLGQTCLDGNGHICLDGSVCPGATTCCTRTTCASRGSTCGSFSDGCGSIANCGTCAVGQVCVNNTSCCTPKTCAQLGATCGTVIDGCSALLHCGTCQAGQECTGSNTCCTPTRTCENTGTKCGSIDDGCGIEISCQKINCTVPAVPTHWFLWLVALLGGIGTGLQFRRSRS